MLADEFFDQYECSHQILEPDKIVNYANDLKNYFDKKYGKNKYRIISLGTSPTNVTQSMEYLGCEVIYLPFSDVKSSKNSQKPIPKSYKELKNAQIAMNYLCSKGVGSYRDKKTNVIIDYTASGRSLYYAAKYINEMLLDKNPYRKPKVKAYSLLQIINKLENNNKSSKDIMQVQTDLNDFSFLCASSYITDTSPVPHFSITNDNPTNKGYVLSENKTEEQIFEEFENYSTALSRLYSICLLAQAKNLSK